MVVRPIREAPDPVKLKGMDGDADLVFVGVSNYSLQHYLTERYDLTSTELLVGLVLTTFRNQRDAKCCPSKPTLDRKCHLGHTAVTTALGGLIRKGVLVRKDGTGVRNKVSRYYFPYDEAAARQLYERNRMAIDAFDDD